MRHFDLENIDRLGIIWQRTEKPSPPSRVSENDTTVVSEPSQQKKQSGTKQAGTSFSSQFFFGWSPLAKKGNFNMITMQSCCDVRGVWVAVSGNKVAARRCSGRGSTLFAASRSISRSPRELYALLLRNIIGL
jgi:hypothetical protein